MAGQAQGDVMVREGDIVNGTAGQRWMVGPKRGQGTCCTVYEVTLHGEHKTRGALKLYKKGDNFAGAHDREAMLLELVHKKDHCNHIVSVIDNFSHKGLPCLVHELLDCDIRQTLYKNRDKGLSFHVIQKFAWQLLVGLDRLHSCDFIHGDLKPSNLMWDPDRGILKVIDFSLSFHVDDQNVGLLQSQGYRSPEVELWNRTFLPRDEDDENLPASAASLGDMKDIDHVTRPGKSCDLWSVGCLLVEMFTGEKMFTREKLQEILELNDRLLAGGGNEMMTLWISQLIRARAHDDCQSNSRQLLAKFTDLVNCLLQFESDQRIFTSACLSHPFFSVQTTTSVSDFLILPTRVLRLVNMVEEGEINDPEAILDIKQDIQEECEKYGAVCQIIMPTNGRGKGKVYVEFCDGFSSSSAFAKICKKTFNFQAVLVSFYPMEYMAEGRFE